MEQIFKKKYKGSILSKKLQQIYENFTTTLKATRKYKADLLENPKNLFLKGYFD